MRAIIDRLEDGFAVLELDDETTVNIPLEHAPEGAREGAVVEYENGAILSIDEAATAARAARLRAPLERLKNRETQ